MINFVEVDAKQIEQELIKQFEEALGVTLYPGDERRIFLQQQTQLIVGLKNNINDSALQNLLWYARGPVLDALGEFYGATRLPAQKAIVTLQFTLSAAQANDVTIPAGTRATPDGLLYFATTQALTITAGNTTGSVSAEATVEGVSYNDFEPGQIATIVDPVPFVASVTNTDTSSGGSDIESDDNFRKRIQLAPAAYSTAGPEKAYIYWAKTADVNIADISVTSLSAGTVTIYVLMTGGQLPTQDILDAVEAAVNDKTKRPLTDSVSASAPTTQAYNIDLTYYISSEWAADEASIRSAIEDSGGAVDQYKAWQSEKLGRAINPDYLRQLILNAGASRIVMTSPAYQALTLDKVAALGTTTITYGGLE